MPKIFSCLPRSSQLSFHLLSKTFSQLADGTNSSSRKFRFVPPKPIWQWHDQILPDGDSFIFHIPSTELPQKTTLDISKIPLLQRLSLITSDCKITKAIVDEAINFSDCLLTQAAFNGTTGAHVSASSVEPMLSLLETMQPAGQLLSSDEGLQSVDEISKQIVSNSMVTWENYFVAPPGNIPVHTNTCTDTPDIPE